jgi:hypothetical protein
MRDTTLFRRVASSATWPLQIDCAHHRPAVRAGAMNANARNLENPFDAWLMRWKALAHFEGVAPPDAAARTDALIRLLHEEVPGIWRRSLEGMPRRLQSPNSGYSRGDAAHPHTGEHDIESAILGSIPTALTIFGRRVTLGRNALPLVLDPGGGRKNNVEADLLLLCSDELGCRGWICEVKDEANDPWSAMLQNLMQLKLAHHSPWITAACERWWGGPLDAPFTGVVIAAESFYRAAGRKSQSLDAVYSTLSRITAEGLPVVQFATWHADRAAIARYPADR